MNVSNLKVLIIGFLVLSGCTDKKENQTPLQDSPQIIEDNTQKVKDELATSKNEEQAVATSVLIADAWARATFEMATTGAAYAKLNNTSNTTITLLSASISDDIAQKVELHTTVMQGDMMQMQELENGIEISAQGSVDLSPGGMHLMLMGLTGALQAGDSFDIEFRFSDNSKIVEKFTVIDKRN